MTLSEMAIKMVGLTSLIRENEKAGRQFDPEIRQDMQKSVLLVEGEAKQLAKASATFRRTIHSQVRGTGARIKGIVGTNDKRGRWMEEGTGIHHTPDAREPWVIVARNRKALAIPVAADVAGAQARWAVKDEGPFQYTRMTDKKGRELFRTRKGGSTFNPGKAQNVIFRKRVVIKGMKPKPWLMPAFRNKRPEIEMIFRKRLHDINRRLTTAARQRETGD